MSPTDQLVGPGTSLHLSEPQHPHWEMGTAKPITWDLIVVIIDHLCRYNDDQFSVIIINTMWTSVSKIHVSLEASFPNFSESWIIQAPCESIQSFCLSFNSCNSLYMYISTSQMDDLSLTARDRVTLQGLLRGSVRAG